MKRGVVLLGVIVLGLGAALGAAVWLLLDPPFLTWQHGAELAPALERYAATAMPGAAVEVARVREYTDGCSVARTLLRPPEGTPLTVWALLYRLDGAWQVFWTEAESGAVASVLAWGQVCAQREAPIPALEIPEPPEQ